MEIQINDEAAKLLSKVFKTDINAVKFGSEEAAEFAKHLKENFDKIDSNQDSNLSEKEIGASLKESEVNPELKKIIDNTNLESLMAKLDTNQDSAIDKKELNPKTEISDIAKTVWNEIRNSEECESAVKTMTDKLCKTYNVGGIGQNIIQNTVNSIF